VQGSVKREGAVDTEVEAEVEEGVQSVREHPVYRIGLEEGIR
jgi:hypothetical protein